jgi:hypothetical protein
MHYKLSTDSPSGPYIVVNATSEDLNRLRDYFQRNNIDCEIQHQAATGVDIIKFQRGVQTDELKVLLSKWHIQPRVEEGICNVRCSACGAELDPIPNYQQLDDSGQFETALDLLREDHLSKCDVLSRTA